MTIHRVFLSAGLLALALVTGCATPVPPYDYAAFTKAKPATLLVLPPLSESPSVNAAPAMWSSTTQPLAEAGYYVLPVTLVDETFRQNGVTTAHDAHEIPVWKLREVFGADAAVYVTVKQYGTTYAVLSSESRVTVEGRIVDLRSGELLWQGRATASSAEQHRQAQGGLAGMLVTALVKQIVGTATDEAYKYAGIAGHRMLSAPRFNGVPAGPRSPHYGRPSPEEP